MFFRRQHNHEQQDTDEVVFDNQMAAFTFLQPTDKDSRPRLVRFCSYAYKVIDGIETER